MSKPQHHGAIAASLLFVVILWGANNVGSKWLVNRWPPVFTGDGRFLAGGLILLACLRLTPWLGDFQPLTPALRRALWFQASLMLAAYIVAFNWALRLTSASLVALYLSASPVWILLAESRREPLWEILRRLAAAALAVAGIVVLFWPALHGRSVSYWGGILALAASFCWAAYGHYSRQLTKHLNGAEVAAHTMWMAGVWLLPVSFWELWHHPIAANLAQVGVMAFCVVFGAVVAYALWNQALRHWRASQVMLFTNLIPLSTSLWAWILIGEPMTSTFWLAMILIVAGVILGQTPLRGRAKPA